jgi:transposase
LLLVLEALDLQIGQFSASLKQTAMEDDYARLLTIISGVGYYAALFLVAEISDINRFPDSEKFCSYEGFVHSVR